MVDDNAGFLKGLIMIAAADQFDDTPSPPDLQQFVYLAKSAVELLETAKHELERDRQATLARLDLAPILRPPLFSWRWF